MSVKSFSASQAQVLVVDMQQSLYPVLYGAARVLQKSRTLLTCAQLMDVPITFVEQYPQGLGKTHADLAGFISVCFEKTTFSALQQPDLAQHIADIKQQQNRPDLILLGCESHVCLLQTALGAMTLGYNVVVVWDATASRYEADRSLAKTRLEQAGCQLVSTEMLVFEWLQGRSHANFKQMIELIRQH
ncbi:isochorismatase family protein [Aliiglaciecola sp. LCG003]|uniref:isochorismatase family protein n=1 Tax=Aliiglaciecola sp. LCG003 TaxID=3053655 RepID=UPI00257302C7|nr:isochorismatase family protein [Aliiglaciecola sp. LCG003]WJG08224.1 isochorismatase family protein [Aliiglaciecola sp. LCG003]